MTTQTQSDRIAITMQLKDWLALVDAIGRLHAACLDPSHRPAAEASHALNLVGYCTERSHLTR